MQSKIYMNIKNLAKQLIKKYGLNDPLEIVLAKGIILLEEELGEVYGYSHTYKRQSLIHLNKNCSLKTKRLVCAHELGYLLIHPKEEIHLVTDSSLEPKDDFGFILKNLKLLQKSKIKKSYLSCPTPSKSRQTLVPLPIKT